MYTIHHFFVHKKHASEALKKGTLSSQMTQHCLGTGVYGFINPLENANNYYSQKELILDHPLILETETQYNDFVWFMMHINKYVYFSYHNIQMFGNIFDEIIPNDFNLTKEEIIKRIEKFNNDYDSLKENEMMPMPTNYLFQPTYDGIYNMGNDSAAAGSVKFIFPRPQHYKRAFDENVKLNFLNNF